MAQLTMKLQALTDYRAPALPEGYTLTTLDPETDIQGWIETCAEGLGTAEWTEEDFRKRMLETDGLCAERIYVVKHEGRVIATATAWPLSETRGNLHMVAARPEYRGKHLGSIVVGAVLEWLTAQGMTDIRLSTDDFRLAAIKVYLNFGFLPILSDFDMPGRWKAIYETLGVSYPVYHVRMEAAPLE